MSANDNAKRHQDDPPEEARKRSHRRKPSEKATINPGLLVQKEFKETNSTMNAFVGGKQKAWLTSPSQYNPPARPAEGTPTGTETPRDPQIPSVSDNASSVPHRVSLGGERPEAAAAPGSDPASIGGALERRSVSSPSVHGSPLVPRPDLISPPLTHPLQRAGQPPTAGSGSPPSTSILSQHSRPSSLGDQEGHFAGDRPIVSERRVTGAEARAADPTRGDVVPLTTVQGSTQRNETGVESRGRPSSQEAQPSSGNMRPEMNKKLSDLIAKYGIDRVEALFGQTTGSNEDVPPGEGTGRTPTIPPSQVQASQQRSAAVPTPPVQGSRQGQNVPFPGQGSGNPVPTQSTSESSLRPLMVHLQSQATQMLSSAASRNIPDPTRFHILIGACVNEDVFCLVLHQIFSCHSMNPNLAFTLIGRSLSKGQTLNLLTALFGSPSSVSGPITAWFAGFPAPESDLRNPSTYWGRVCQHVAQYLDVCESGWQRLQAACQARGFPPIVDEFSTLVKLESIMLQRLAFNIILEKLWSGPKNPSFVKMQELFVKYQLDFHRNRATRLTSAPLPGNFMERRRLETIAGYQQILNQQRDAQRRFSNSSAPVPGSPVAAQRPLGAFQGSFNLSSQISPPGSTPASPIHSQGAQALGVLPVSQRNPQSLGRGLAMAPPSMTMVPSQMHVATGSGVSGFASPVPGHGQLSPRFNQPQHSPQLMPPPPSPALRSPQTQSPQSGPMQGWPRFAGSVYPQDQNTRSLGPIHSRVNSSGSTPTLAGNTAQGHIDPRTTHNPTYAARNNTPVSRSFNSPYQAASGHTAHRQLQSQPAMDRPAEQINPLVALTSGNYTENQDEMLFPPLHKIKNKPEEPHVKVNVHEASLMQAHMRSPHLIPADLDKGKPPRFYQQVIGFAMRPRFLEYHQVCFHTSFDLDKQFVDRRPERVEPAIEGDRFFHFYRDGTVHCRLRCCIRDSVEKPCSDSEWVLLDQVWPGFMISVMNGHGLVDGLEARRKAQHNKDLPIDVTAFVKAGENPISVTSYRFNEKPTSWCYAVEIVEMISHERILKTCMEKNFVSVKDSLGAIQARLGAARTLKATAEGNEDEEDLTVVSDSMNIDIIDPFSSSVIDIPVRGPMCHHLECFDLETFLTTRPKYKHFFPREDHPSTVDDWKCPLCRGDARPVVLKVDGFFHEVRAKLEEQGLLKTTKTIAVNRDGTWVARSEGGNVKSEPQQPRTPKTGSKTPVFVDLTDD